MVDGFVGNILVCHNRRVHEWNLVAVHVGTTEHAPCGNWDDNKELVTIIAYRDIVIALDGSVDGAAAVLVHDVSIYIARTNEERSLVDCNGLLGDGATKDNANGLDNGGLTDGVRRDESSSVVGLCHKNIVNVNLNGVEVADGIGAVSRDIDGDGRF